MGQSHPRQIFRWLCVCLGCVLAASWVTGCAHFVQLRMADPVVGPTEGGALDPPEVTFHKRHGTHSDSAVIAWENPVKPVKNRVNLHTKSLYNVSVTLPENFEFRRMQVLQGKSETLYKSIEAADAELRTDTEKRVKLLGDDARAKVLADCEDLRERINKHSLQLVSAPNETEREANKRAIDTLAAQVAEKDALLRADDKERDTLLTPAMSVSLVNQIEDWRTQLNTIKSRVVALNMMVQNTNDPYPRVIRGTMEVFDRTPFTDVGAIPVGIEDEYLDWIREDKVVTIVSYDPNEKPEAKGAAERRAQLPEHWPQSGLCVIEFRDYTGALARGDHAGAAPAAYVANSGKNGRFYDCQAAAYRSENGYERTYIRSADKSRTWVFGPDLTPPANVEVWLQDASSALSTKLYPPDAREKADEVFVRQIAGVEGGAFDPVAEAKKRGKVVSIMRLGNLRQNGDSKVIQRIHGEELRRAQERVTDGAK